MKISYRPADEAYAREFLQWQYEAPYDIYNFPPAQLEKYVQYNIDPSNNVHAMFDQEDKLIGYCSYGLDAQVPGGDYSEEALDIGMMIKPELTGQGQGSNYVSTVIQNSVSKYHPRRLRVTILSTNLRAMKVWEKNGFQKTQTFESKKSQIEFSIFIKDV